MFTLSPMNGLQVFTWLRADYKHFVPSALSNTFGRNAQVNLVQQKLQQSARRGDAGESMIPIARESRVHCRVSIRSKLFLLQAASLFLDARFFSISRGFQAAIANEFNYAA